MDLRKKAQVQQDDRQKQPHKQRGGLNLNVFRSSEARIFIHEELVLPFQRMYPVKQAQL